VRLQSLRLYNFRPFYKKAQTIEFAQKAPQNVTIIIGNNGAGKTAILNALTWCLYEKFTDALGNPEYLVNRRAIAEASVGDTVSCWVELTFEHAGRQYKITRTKTVRKRNGSGETDDVGSSVVMQMGGEDGRWKEISDREEIRSAINRILPEDLHRYFFFDGERIEHLQRPDKKKEIQSATSKLIGEEVLSRAITHLDNARKHFEGELKKIGDTETKHLLEEQHSLENQLQDLQNSLQANRQNIEAFKKEKQEVEACLREVRAVEGLQKRRDELTELRQSEQKKIEDIRRRLAKELSSNGYTVFLDRAIQKFLEINSCLRSSGELPSAIKAFFLEGLLNKGECICGRELKPGDKAYEKVASLKETAGLSNVEEAIIRTESDIKDLQKRKDSLFNSLDDLQKERSAAKQLLSKIQDELDDIKERLKNSPEEQARQLQKKLDEIEQYIEEEQETAIRIQHNIDSLSQEIRRYQEEITRKKSLNTKQATAQRRVEACLQAKDVLEKIRFAVRANFRRELSDRIKEIFTSITFKPYVPVLKEDYSLQLFEGDSHSLPVGASTGENQALSLAFIGAIIEQAKRLQKDKDNLLTGPDTSAFPIVMDSAFGNLDPIYRSQIVNKIPDIANQVIMLVTKAQWQNEVAAMSASRIGKQYVIRYTTPKKDAIEDSVNLRTGTYDLVRKTLSEFESSEIVEVINV